MIQAVNFSTNHYSKTNSKPSFAQKAPEEFVDYKPEEVKNKKKKSKLGAFAGYIGTQFAAGVVVSGIMDSLVNAYRVVTKKSALIPLKTMAFRAGATGSMFALIGLVLAGVAAIVSKKLSKKHKN